MSGETRPRWLSVPMRILFANSGIMGHKTVHRLISDLVPSIPGIQSTTVDLSESLTLSDRLLRRVMCFHPASTNWDLARWRMECFTGWHMRRVLRRLETKHGPFEMLHLHPQALGYALLGRMRRTPTIISIDCTQQLALEESNGQARWSYRPSFWHDNLVFRRARSIVSVSRWATGLLRSLSVDFASKTVTAPYPIDVSRFPAAWVEERLNRSQSKTYKPVVLFVGGDFQRKGGDALLSLWRSENLGETAELRLVTSPRTLPTELPRGVTVLTGLRPYEPDWFQCWREADIFALPTRAEAFGMVYQEAAAAGLPAVATSVCAVPELVLDGVTGILIPPGDQSKLKQTLATLVDQATLRAQMGTAARKHMERLCGLDVYRERLVEALQRARPGFQQD